LTATPRPSRAEILALLAILALALALRVPLLGRGFQGDEIRTMLDFVEAPSAWETISRVVDFNNHHFYSLLARGAEAALGRAEWVVRLPALLFGLLTVPAVWLGLRRDFGSRIGLFTALLLATSPIHIGFSATARGYTGLLFFTWSATILFFGVLRDEGRVSRVVAYAVLSALGIWTHLYGAAVLAVQAAFLAILLGAAARHDGLNPALRRIGLAVAGVAGAALLTLLLYAPALPRLLPVLRSAQHGSFDRRFPLQVLTYLVGLPLGVAGLLLGGIALVGLAWGLRSRRLAALYVALVFVLPVGATWVARPQTVMERFFFFLLPFVALGVALCVTLVVQEAWASADATTSAWVRAAPRVVAVSLLVLTTWLWASRPWSNVPTGAYREAVAALEAPPSHPGASLGVCVLGRNTRYYGWYAKHPPLIPASVEQFEAFFAEHDAVRCAWGPTPSELPAHTAIAAILQSRCDALDHFLGIRMYQCEHQK
jgi:uncharacterized membrane protein